MPITHRPTARPLRTRIRNDQQQQAAVRQVSALMQGLVDYAKDQPNERPRIQFPRNTITPPTDLERSHYAIAGGQRGVARTIADQHTFLDLMRVVLDYTDVYGRVREAGIKMYVIGAASILEAGLQSYSEGMKLGMGRTVRQILHLHGEGKLDPETAQLMMWLWNKRNRIHISLPEDKQKESGEFGEGEYHKAQRALGLTVEAFAQLAKELPTPTRKAARRPVCDFDTPPTRGLRMAASM